MCHCTNNNLSKVASKLIKTYKVVEYSKNDSDKEFTTPFMGFKGRYNTVLDSQIDDFNFILEEPNPDFKYVILEGFHSCLGKDLAIDLTNIDLLGRYGVSLRCIKLAVIPKGAKYDIGIDDDVVSTQLIVFSSYWRYLMYKLFGKL